MKRLLGLSLLVLVSGCSGDEGKIKAKDYKETGDFYYQNGKWPQAHAEYVAALAHDDELIEAYIAVGYTCRMIGKLEWIKSPNEYGRRMAEGSYREAHAWAERCLEEEEGNAEAFHLKGLLWYDAGKFERAIENFDEALDHNPHHQHASYYKSWCLFYQGVTLHGKSTDAGEKGDTDSQRVLISESVEKYQAAAKAMEAYIKNYDKESTSRVPQESDLKNWIQGLKEMAKADGAVTEDVRTVLGKIKHMTPALTKEGAEAGSKDGQPVIHEDDLPPSAPK